MLNLQLKFEQQGPGITWLCSYLGLCSLTEGAILGAQFVQFVLGFSGGQGAAFVTDAVQHRLMGHDVLAASLHIMKFG